MQYFPHCTIMLCLLILGEKVDQKQVETLEEIFKRVQFRTLDLENTYLEEEVLINSHDVL